ILIFIFYILFYIGKKVNNFLNRDYNLIEELVEKDNPAVALAITGYYAGLVIAIGGVLVGDSVSILDDVLDLCIYGILSIILLNISWFICDKIILYKFKVSEELVRDRNTGTGAVSLGLSIATGFMIYGAISGEGGNIWTALGFWAIGQVTLILAAFIYNLITPYNIHDEIEKDNVAAGVSFAGALIGVGVIVGLAAEGDFVSWSENLYEYITFSLAGLVLLPIIRTLTDKILLPTVKLSNEITGLKNNNEIEEKGPNIGAAFIEAFSYIAGAYIIYWCV
ncbi:MAG: DUF350 domain-containing protein, partial [Deltaproteobacteria bacterium]|nr:DUF350 domain-containing protein [Deltaproteobacteria bacterium]